MIDTHTHTSVSERSLKFCRIGKFGGVESFRFFTCVRRWVKFLRPCLLALKRGEGVLMLCGVGSRDKVPNCRWSYREYGVWV